MSQKALRTSFDPRYRFSNFVAGFQNLEALGVARQIGSGAPLALGTPVVIWGDPGVGKTHLLHAIGNAVMEREPSAQIRIVFGARWETTKAFQQYLQRADLVLVESAHFLPGFFRGRPRPSSEKAVRRSFEMTIAALIARGRQVVLESDRSPAHLRKWGMPLPRSTTGIEIKDPDLLTRTAILKLKSRQHLRRELPDDVAFLIADLVENPRELEGALSRLRGVEGPLTVKRAKARLREMLEIYRLPGLPNHGLTVQ